MKYGEHADIDDVWTDDDDKLIMLRIKVIVKRSDDNKLWLGNEERGEKEEKGTSMHHGILPHSFDILEK